MTNIPIYNLEGKKITEQNVAKFFDVKENQLVFSQAVNYQTANSQKPYASTKNRGQVRGGGRKPFKQKGTGNARAGSNRSPLWIGGGVTFGPNANRSFAKKIPKKVISLALKMVIADKIRDKKLIILDQLELQKASTKQIQAIFEKMPIVEGKILVILPKLNANVELSLANIPYAKVIKAENLNVLDISKFDYLLTSKEGFDKITQIFQTKTKAAT